MQGAGRRSVTRALVALAAAVVALCASAVPSVAAESPITLSVQLGYHNTLKLGQWMPVGVDVTNRGPDFEGTLEVQASNSAGGPPMGAAIYEAPVSLASGATKHYRTYISMDFPGAVSVRVVQGGHVVASQDLTSPNTFSGLLVGILSDRPSTLDALGSLHPGGTAPQVEHVAAADLSDSAPVLRAFDVIAIDDFASDTLTSAQKAGLEDYVLQGGSLLTGTGGAWRKTLSGLPAALVPMSITGSTVTPSLGALGGAKGVEVATGNVNPGATAWLSDGTLPLVVEARTGQGMIALATFDWAQDAVTGASDYATVLRQTLVRLTYGSISNPTTAGQMVTKLGAGSSISVAMKGGTLAQALGAIPALDLPAWWLIGTLVFLYVLLVGPVNYFVLRAVGRRALAWITVPTIALVASAGAYGTSVITKGTSVLVNEVSVIHVEPGSSRAAQEEYTGIMTPTRGDYQVGLGGDRSLVSPIYYYSGNTSDSSLAAMRINTVSSDITLPGMTAFTLRGFANEGMLANAPDVSGQAQLVGGQVSGVIKNSSAIEFTDGVVISGNSFQKIGALRPGENTSFSMQPSPATYGGQPLTIYPSNYQFNGMYPNNTNDVEREMETRSAVISTVIPNIYIGAPGSSVAVAVLWTRQPFQAVTVNGSHPRTYVESAVVLELPIERIGAGSMPSGIVQGRIIDLNADTSGSAGPPGIVVAQSGSITYSFDPALAPGTRLRSASIVSSNPYGAKGVPGATGTVGTVKAQAWDWSQGAWVDLGYADTGTTLVPDSAVNPTTGEVVMKLSSDGQFMTGSLSLQGSVG
ncbi:MAG TPA: hypothetical protein VFL27_05090 [Candidatus Dormibacteraeota bacterium]|nr:hypothetical protein [Candidatus Dormibacteraeota bacterium]